MKIFARIAAAVTAVFASLMVAAPALAHDTEKFDPTEQFSTAGQPADVAAILVTGVIVLVLVLVLSQWISGAFVKSSN